MLAFPADGAAFLVTNHTMTMMRNYIFSFRVQANSLPARCHVRLIRNHGQTTVIVSELAENTGMSICNAFEDLLPQLAQRFDLDGRDLLYIEHWGAFSSRPKEKAREEAFCLVHFHYDPDGSHPMVERRGTFSEPVWKPLSRQDVEAMLAMELPPFPFPQTAA